MKTRCTHCEHVWNVSDEFAGRLVRCKNCDQSFTVEEVTGAPVEAAPAGAAAPAPAPTTPAASTGQFLQPRKGLTHEGVELQR
jgi:hypothetical protein